LQIEFEDSPSIAVPRPISHLPTARIAREYSCAHWAAPLSSTRKLSPPDSCPFPNRCVASRTWNLPANCSRPDSEGNQRAHRAAVRGYRKLRRGRLRSVTFRVAGRMWRPKIFYRLVRGGREFPRHVRRQKIRMQGPDSGRGTGEILAGYDSEVILLRGLSDSTLRYRSKSCSPQLSAWLQAIGAQNLVRRRPAR
jgi:hypothetical protein